MYKVSDKSQHSFLDFNQPIGLHLDPNNRWIKLAELVPWDEFETKYAKKFKNDTGNVAKPLRLALGSLIIQKKLGCSDRELVQQLAENPYLQYFVGLPGFHEEAPIDASTLVLFRKRLNARILIEANEAILEAQAEAEKANDDDDDDDANPPEPDEGSQSLTNTEATNKSDNKGTLILDATCAPSNIRYPQDISLLNESREKLEAIIDRFCKAYGLKKPRMYRKVARKEFLKWAKAKKHSKNKIRKALRKQLGYVQRDLKYLEGFMTDGYAPLKKEIMLIETIYTLFVQQEYMYKEKTHSVPDRIVSISQPWLRPIVRGKVKAPVEFGAKLDLSLDEDGFARIENMSFDAYNESTCLISTIEKYKDRTGHYPQRVLVDQIYRNRENRRFCKDHGIRISGPKLGRPSITAKEDKKTEYQDNTDRIEVEREFSVEKRCYGLGSIVTKREDTTLSSIALSVFVANLFKIHKRVLSALVYLIGLITKIDTLFKPEVA